MVEALSRDYRSAALAECDRAILDFVAKLTRTPGAMQRDDVRRLRRHGLDDRTIHDVVVVAAYYAFVNRIADGLGVELEPGWERERP